MERSFKERDIYIILSVNGFIYNDTNFNICFTNQIERDRTEYFFPHLLFVSVLTSMRVSRMIQVVQALHITNLFNELTLLPFLSIQK